MNPLEPESGCFYKATSAMTHMLCNWCVVGMMTVCVGSSAHHFVGRSQIEAQAASHSAHQQQEDGRPVVELVAYTLSLLLWRGAV